MKQINNTSNQRTILRNEFCGGIMNTGDKRVVLFLRLDKLWSEGSRIIPSFIAQK